MKQIERSQFKELIERDLWWWIPMRERRTSSWFLSLRSWADKRFNEEYEKEQREKNKE